MADNPWDDQLQSAFATGQSDIDRLLNAYGSDIQRLQSGQPNQSDIDFAATQSAGMSRARGIGGPLAQRMAQRATGRVQSDFMRDRDARVAQARAQQLQATMQAKQQQQLMLQAMQSLQEQRNQQAAALAQQQRAFEAQRQMAIMSAIGQGVGAIGGGLYAKARSGFSPEEVLKAVSTGSQLGQGIGGALGAGTMPNYYSTGWNYPRSY